MKQEIGLMDDMHMYLWLFSGLNLLSFDGVLGPTKRQTA
jgi:hypothetical protein